MQGWLEFLNQRSIGQQNEALQSSGINASIK